MARQHTPQPIYAVNGRPALKETYPAEGLGVGFRACSGGCLDKSALRIESNRHAYTSVEVVVMVRGSL